MITHSHVRQCLYPVLMYSEQWRMYVEANTGNIGLGTSYHWKKDVRGITLTLIHYF